MWCKCQRLKKDWICSDVQVASANLKVQNSRSHLGVGLLPCDEECLKLAEERRVKEEVDGLHQRKLSTSEVKISSTYGNKSSH